VVAGQDLDPLDLGAFSKAAIARSVVDAGNSGNGLGLG
jgi:hypothetical protein